MNEFGIPVKLTKSVSYTHLDVYKRQVKDEVSKCSEKYLSKLELHPNILAINNLDLFMLYFF